MSTNDLSTGQHHRTLFLSDLHLGADGSRADLVLEFLRANSAETYFLVGDILEPPKPGKADRGLRAGRVIDWLARQAGNGATIIYVKGNHDLAQTTETAAVLGEMHSHAIHQLADGRRFLITHGDEEDVGLFQIAWLQRLGSLCDGWTRRADLRVALFLRRKFGLGLGRGVMPRVVSGLNAVMYRWGGHERRLVGHARALALDGVVCGHFHLPRLHDDHQQTYANCGDWLDSFTALAEDHRGALSLLQVQTPPRERAMARRASGPAIGLGTA